MAIVTRKSSKLSLAYCRCLSQDAGQEATDPTKQRAAICMPVVVKGLCIRIEND